VGHVRFERSFYGGAVVDERAPAIRDERRKRECAGTAIAQRFENAGGRKWIEARRGIANGDPVCARGLLEPHAWRRTNPGDVARGHDQLCDPGIGELLQNDLDGPSVVAAVRRLCQHQGEKRSAGSGHMYR
jgi:hypothetical protein